MIKMGLISFAHGHAFGYGRALASIPDAQLVGVWDDNEDRGRKAAAQYETVFYEKVEDLLQQSDAVMISSENANHYLHASAAARAGVHILLEKPLTTDGYDGRALIDLCESNGTVLQTAFPVRCHSSVRRIKEKLDCGEIGDILAIAATNHGKMPGGWFVNPALSGGGAINDHTVHVVDLMRHMLGQEAEEVYAESDTRFHDIATDDCGLLSIRFDGGVIATLDTSWSRPVSYPIWGDVTMRIVGTKGALHLDVFSQHMQLWENSGKPNHRYVSWGEDANVTLLEEFAASIREGRPSRISGLDGLRASEVAWAAYESVLHERPIQVKHY